MDNEPQDKYGYDEAIQNTIAEQQENNTHGALMILNTLIDKYEADPYVDDEKSEYRYFDNPLEAVLYQVMTEPTKEVEQMERNFGYMYALRGMLLFEDDKAKAIESLELAHALTPSEPKIFFEIAEDYRVLENWDQFLAYTRKAWEISYLTEDVAQVFRNFAVYYLSHDDIDFAAQLLFISLAYEQDSDMAQSTLSQIAEVTGKEPTQPDENTGARLEKENIPAMANHMVIQVAMDLGRSALDEGFPTQAKELFQIVYNLTSDDEVQTMINELPEA